MENCSDKNDLKKSEIKWSKIEEIKYSWKSIKSLYNLNQIFYFLNIKQKVKIISYNKELQKKLKINIENYKKLSGKYIIGDRNGKGKEYNYFNDKLIFEGEYLNGKRNGKGKEYYNYIGKLKYEGEYLDGKKWNGKEYNYYGNLKYEGEYLDGKKWNGKEYNYYGNLKFEGEYLNGERQENVFIKFIHNILFILIIYFIIKYILFKL